MSFVFSMFSNITYRVRGVNHFSGNPYAFCSIGSAFVFHCLLSQYSINTELVRTFIGCRITNIKNIYKSKYHLCDSSQAPSAGLHSVC